MDDLAGLVDGMRREIVSELPELEEVAAYYWSAASKRVRPALVLRLARALAGAPSRAPSAAVLALELANETPAEAARRDAAGLPVLDGVWPRQRRLAEVVEMVHTASLLHDDVVDAADRRRGLPSANVRYGNKLAVLAGDYLLARSSFALAGLGDLAVTRLLSSVIADLVEGEFWQLRSLAAPLAMRPAKPPRAGPAADVLAAPCVWPALLSSLAVAESLRPLFAAYLRKTYLKTASLMAKSCAAVAVLGGVSASLVLSCLELGECIGMAFQIADDVLDFTGRTADAGKPVGVDLELGLATAPVLFAADIDPPRLLPLIARRFELAGDARAAGAAVTPLALDRARSLAKDFVREAHSRLAQLPESVARSSLVDMIDSLVDRSV